MSDDNSSYQSKYMHSFGVYMVYPFEPNLDPLDPRSKIKGGEPIEELDNIPICAVDLAKGLKVRHKLRPPIWGQIIEFLQQNLHVFTWSHGNMEGITCH